MFSDVPILVLPEAPPSHTLHHLLYTFLVCTTSLSLKVPVTFLPSVSLNHSLLPS